MSFFDTLIDDSENINDVKQDPFHTVAGKSEKEVLEWLKQATETRMKVEGPRHHRLKSNLAVYRGLTYRQPHTRSTYRLTERIPVNRAERFVVNHLFDLTESKVAQITRHKPAVEILPNNNEYSDKNAARATKMLIDHLWHVNRIDDLMQEMHRHKKIFGEAFLFVDWNKDKGDKHPMAGRVDPSDDMVIDPNLRIGDVDYDLEVPWRVILQRKRKFCDVEWAFRIKIENVKDLKKEYPDKEGKIKSNSSAYAFDYATLEDEPLNDETVVYTFYHKKSKHLPEGRVIKFTPEVILEDSGETYPYSHGEFPFERITDIDIPHVLSGVSTFEIVKPIQNMHDNLSTLISKNIYMMAHAKWVMPKGACNVESLGNDNTIIKYQGPTPPQMIQVAPNPPEVYNYREILKSEMEQIFTVHGVSRGNPPSGITAAVAMQFLNEQEAERSSVEIAKYNDFIRRMAQKTLATCSDYYEVDDERLVKILGNDNKYLIQHFDSANLSKSYDVRVQNSNALADTKAAQIQRIIELIQYKPDALSPERVVELLDLGKADKAVTLITQAVRAAESEVEDILEGKPVADPEPWEDFITHWRVKVKAMQRREFKEEVLPEFRQALIDNVRMLEYLMTQKAKENPLFQAKLAQLDLFPLFYREGFTPASAEQQQALVQGQANRGEPISGSIPGTEPLPLPGEPNRGSEE